MRRKEPKGRPCHERAGMQGDEPVTGLVRGAGFPEEDGAPGKASADPGMLECPPTQRQKKMLDGILRSLLGLLLEAHTRVKEETERQSFADPEECSLSFITALCLCRCLLPY